MHQEWAQAGQLVSPRLSLTIAFDASACQLPREYYSKTLRAHVYQVYGKREAPNPSIEPY